MFNIISASVLRHLGAVDRAGRHRNGVRRPGLESLEGRTLLTGLLSEFPAYGTAMPPQAPTTGGSGSMAVLPDGSLWMAEGGAGQTSRLDLIAPDGSVTERVTIPGRHAEAFGLTTTADGSLWFLVTGANSNDKIGRIAPGGGLQLFSMGSGTATSLTTGPDGNVWFFDQQVTSAGTFDRIDSSGVITRYAIGSLNIDQLVLGPDGNFWFDTANNEIGRIDLSGNVTEFPTSSTYEGPPVGGTIGVGDLTVGPDGNLWFVNGTKIDRMTTSGVITEFATPVSGNGDIDGLVAGSDGNLYFSYQQSSDPSSYSENRGYVGQITPEGVVTVLPVNPQYIWAMVAAPDGSLWLDEGGGLLGRIDLSQAPSDPSFIHLAAAPPLSVLPGQTLAGTIVSFTASDPTSQASDFSASINWGDGHVSAGTVTPDAQGGFDVIGSNTYGADLPAGRTVTVTVSGEDGSSATLYNHVSIADPAAAAPLSNLKPVSGGHKTLPGSHPVPHHHSGPLHRPVRDHGRRR